MSYHLSRSRKNLHHFLIELNPKQGTIYVPKIICSEYERVLIDLQLKYTKYPVTKDLLPDTKFINKLPINQEQDLLIICDFFGFTHYEKILSLFQNKFTHVYLDLAQSGPLRIPNSINMPYSVSIYKAFGTRFGSYCYPPYEKPNIVQLLYESFQTIILYTPKLLLFRRSRRLLKNNLFSFLNHMISQPWFKKYNKSLLFPHRLFLPIEVSIRKTLLHYLTDKLHEASIRYPDSILIPYSAETNYMCYGIPFWLSSHNRDSITDYFSQNGIFVTPWPDNTRNYDINLGFLYYINLAP